MTKIILCGCSGKMGAAITGIVNERDDCEIVAGVDVNTACAHGYQVYPRIADVTETADVIIDFSHPSALDSILAFAAEKQIPAVLCTTGYSEAQNRQIEETSQKIVSEELPYDSRYEYDRHSVRRKRERSEIGIHSVRGGSIVGEHEVIFAGHDEVVTIAHSAQSKGVFAAGAVNAAVFMKGKPAGLYDMNNLIAES